MTAMTVHYVHWWSIYWASKKKTSSCLCHKLKENLLVQDFQIETFT